MSLQELAKSAFNNTSFNPEARSEGFMRNYLRSTGADLRGV